MLAGLEANGVVVYRCHAKLWRGIEDRVQKASGGWLRPSFLWRVISAYWRLLQKHRTVPEYDFMLIGYPGQFDSILGRLLSWRRRKPMILDLYMSLYLIAKERGLTTRNPVSGKVIRFLEGVGLRLPDLLISDTEEYVRFHCNTYGLKPDRFRLVPAGADDRIFYPRPELRPPDDIFRIIYYGTFIPNHGVPTMVLAAALLKDQPSVQFDFYGDGPERQAAQELAAAKGLTNVTFHGWLEKEKLPLEIAQSHLCLGVFGTTKQSEITIQNKIWECMAMGRPVITGDAPTIRNTLRHGEEVYLVERANPKVLAEAIKFLRSEDNLRENMGNAASKRFQLNNIEATGRKVIEALYSV